MCVFFILTIEACTLSPVLQFDFFRNNFYIYIFEYSPLVDDVWSPIVVIKSDLALLVNN